VSKDSFNRISVFQRAFDPDYWTRNRREAYVRRDGDASSEQFCRLYWYPVYMEVQRKNASPYDACDVVKLLFAKLRADKEIILPDPPLKSLRPWLTETLEKMTGGGVRVDANIKYARTCLPFDLHAMFAVTAFMVDPFVRENPDTAWEKRLMEIAWDDTIEEIAHSHKGSRREPMLRILMQVMDGGLSLAVAAQQSGQNESALRQRVSRLRDEVRRVLQRKMAVAPGM
jgi:DNA-directed RNA polymerase specialized sigma24 family protein